MRSWGLLAGALLISGSLVHVGGQAPPQFDAATIKPDQLGRPGAWGMKGGPGTSDPGRVTWQEVSLRDLMATAFHVDPRNVLGPSWISGLGSAQLYAFTATVPADTSKHDFDLMFQRFLTEQFSIKLHHEPKLFPAYDLVVAPGGARLKASADQDISEGPNAPMFASDVRYDADGFLVLPPGHRTAAVVKNGLHQTYQQFTMSEFAEGLEGQVTPDGDRTHYVTVIDKTGLTARYDFKLKFDQSVDAIKFGPEVQAALPAQDALGPGSGLPNIFKALEQQLGLKLVKAKDIPLDTIVIDHAERIPAGN
jgi:uncharacterized protein (TIGR03435 family)